MHRKELAVSLVQLKGKYDTTQELECILKQVHEAMIGDFESNRLLKPGKQLEGSLWWNNLQEALRIRVRRTFNRAKKRKAPEGWETYTKKNLHPQRLQEGVSKVKW